MATFRVTLGFKQPDDSWRVNWYREGTSAREVFESTKLSLLAFLQLAHPITRIARISVQNVILLPAAGTVPLASHSRRVSFQAGGAGDANQFAAEHTPDVASNSAILTVNGANGKRRSIAWRGMPDWMVVRDPVTGGDLPHALLIQRLATLSNAMVTQHAAQIRYELPATGANAKVQVANLAAQVNTNNRRVVVTGMENFTNLAVGNRVKFGGSSLVDEVDGIWLKGSFTVLAKPSADSIVIGTKYVSSAALVTPPDLTVRRQEWGVTAFAADPVAGAPAIEFSEFRSRDTGDTVNRRRRKTGRRRRV